MTQSVTVKYTPTQQDYARVLRLFLVRNTVNRIMLGFLVVAFGFVVFNMLAQTTPVTPFEIIWLLFPPLFIIYILVVQPNRMGKQYMADEKMAAERTWEVSDANVQITTSFKPELFEWDMFSKLVTYQDYYLLMFKKNKNNFRFLPRRSFTSPEEQDAFLQLMSSHLSR
jgi:hypothetical protein